MEDPQAAVDRLNEELGPWIGARATLWSYSRAFNTLTLRLSRALPIGDRHLVCKGTAAIKMPIVVPECTVRVKIMDDVRLGGHPALLIGDEHGLIEVLAATAHTAAAE